MSITSRTGDRGWTRLLFNRRVRKDNPRVEAYGTLDELNSLLGLARCRIKHKATRDSVLACQRDLFVVCAELACLPRDRGRLRTQVTAALVRRLEAEIATAERKLGRTLRRFFVPGGSEAGALLDVCRCVCRRAERLVVRLWAKGAIRNAQVLVYLNRLSDLLFLLARAEEKRHLPVRGK